MHAASPAPLAFSAARPLAGRVRLPGDRSISHGALMLAALAVGRSTIEGLLERADVLATAAAMRAMGATVTRAADGRWHVDGVGVGGLLQPEAALDMGSSATSTRLLMGLVASHAITATLVGDASLSRRPMGHLIAPLSRIGATFSASPGGRLPLMVRGIVPAVPIEHRLPVGSAHVKSALLLAGLNTPGITRIIATGPARGRSERLLRSFGADLHVEDRADGTRVTSLVGEAELRPQAITVPVDPSSAAFFAVAALLVPGSEVRIDDVGVSAARAGLYEVLRAMGGDIAFVDRREVGGWPVADLVVRASALRGIDPDPAIVPSMVDELPILFVACALAQGRSRLRGLEELRVKGCDRVAAMADGLRAIGARVEEHEDGLVIDGTGGAPLTGGATVAAGLDHRIAMSFAVAGLASRAPVTIDDAAPIATGLPDFARLLTSLGAGTR